MSYWSMGLKALVLVSTVTILPTAAHGQLIGSEFTVQWQEQFEEVAKRCPGPVFIVLDDYASFMADAKPKGPMCPPPRTPPRPPGGPFIPAYPLLDLSDYYVVYGAKPLPTLKYGAERNQFLQWLMTEEKLRPGVAYAIRPDIAQRLDSTFDGKLVIVTEE